VSQDKLAAIIALMHVDAFGVLASQGWHDGCMERLGTNRLANLRQSRVEGGHA
jgi:hypothetical protein